MNALSAIHTFYVKINMNTNSIGINSDFHDAFINKKYKYLWKCVMYPIKILWNISYAYYVFNKKNNERNIGT